MEVIPVFSLSPSSFWFPHEILNIQFVYSKEKHFIAVDEKKRNPFVAMNTEEMRCEKKDSLNREYMNWKRSGKSEEIQSL